MEVINPHRFPVTAPPAVDFDGFGNASRYFDGTDQVTITDDPSFPTGSQTFACWVKFDAIGTFQDLMLHWAGSIDQASIALVRNTDNKLRLYIDPDGLASTAPTFVAGATSLQANQWYHVAGVFESGSALRVYVNGSLDGSLTSGVAASVHNSTAPFTLGNRTDASFGLAGNMCDCRLYDAALDATDIAAIYGGENITTNLVGHWLKDTPSLLDDIGTNDGTNVGSAFAYDNPSPAVEFGKASRVFNGSGDYIETSNTVSIGTGSISWSAWAKAPNTATGTYPDTIARVGDLNGAGNASYDGLHLLFYQSKLTVYFAEFTNYGGAFIYQTSYTYNANQWYHLCGVLNASTQKLELYVDGVLDGSVDISAAYPWNLTATRPPSIGARKIGTTYNHYYTGNLADVRLYDDALSSTDALALYNGTNVETNLIGHWLTNTDDVKDYAGSNDGTNNGSTYSFDNPLGDGGQYGSASREFSGTNQYITLANSAFPTGDFSISLWVKRHTTDWYDYLSMWEGSGTNRKFAVMNRNFTNRVIFYWIDNTNTSYNIGETSGTVLNANEWYHVGVTYETGVAAKVYINGIEDGSSTSAGTLQSSTADLVIGSRDGSTSYELDGNLADVRIYDTALTGTDMYDLSRGDDFRTNLVGQWLTNQDDVDDYAGSNNGTNTNTTYSQDAPL